MRRTVLVAFVLVSPAVSVLSGCGSDSSVVYGERPPNLQERPGDANAVHGLLTLGGAGSGVRTTLGDAPAEGGTLDRSEGCPELDDNPAVYDDCRLELIVDGIPVGDDVILNGTITSSGDSVEFVGVREEIPARFVTTEEVASLSIAYGDWRIEGDLLRTASGRLHMEDARMFGTLAGDIEFGPIVAVLEDGEEISVGTLVFDYRFDYKNMAFDAYACPVAGSLLVRSDTMFGYCVEASLVEYHGCDELDNTMLAAPMPIDVDPEDWACCLEWNAIEPVEGEELLACLF